MTKKGQSMIVKIQRSITTNADQPQMLIYDKHRKYLYEGPLTTEIGRLFKPDQFKLFAKAEYEKGVLIFGEIVPDPGW